jgi:hypothetical protein
MNKKKHNVGWSIECMEFITEFLRFLGVRKRYWLLPILVLMTLVGGILVLAQGSAISPFMYTLF